MVGRALDDVRALVSAGVAMNTLTTIKSTVAAMVRRELLDLARIKEEGWRTPPPPSPTDHTVRRESQVTEPPPQPSVRTPTASST
jgi:hypothetical protein